MEPAIAHSRVLDLLLNRENPRHDPRKDQAEIIAYLLEDEQVYNLARHIASNGPNPLELIAVFPDEEGNLVVAEGNRRLCALQLLNDPKKAPRDHIGKFSTLAKGSRYPETVMIAEFKDFELARPWLQVLHDGEQDGVGRRRWRTQQKARFTKTTNTSNLSLRLLDYAKSYELISQAQVSDVSITTMTRYLENPEVRWSLGISTTATNSNVEVELEEKKFSEVVGRFIQDALSGVLSSRSKSPDWRAYADQIVSDHGTDSGRVVRQSLVDKPSTVKQAKQTATTRKIAHRIASDRIVFSNSIAGALNELGSGKLSSLYKSLSTLSLTEHPALVTVGAWVLIEAITARHGRGQGISFESYISSQSAKWDLSKDSRKEVLASVRYVAESGNLEKHSSTYTSLDARNLQVHFDVLESSLTRLITECLKA